MKNGFSFICLLVALLTSCQKVDSPMKKSKVLRLNFPYDVSTLDPRKNSDYINSTVHFILFEGLTRMMPASTHELALAKSIDLSEDKKIYTFHLKETFWSDGAPVTAYDFLYSWKSVLDPGFPAPNAHLFYPIKNAEKVKRGLLPTEELGIQALDSLTLIITLEVPTPYFLDLTSFCPFFPVPSHIAKTAQDWADRLTPLFVTNGPFLLKTLAFKSEYIFEKNPNYWDASSVKLDKIDIMVLDNELTALNLFENKELDFYGAYNSIPSDWAAKLKQEKKLITQAFGATTFLTFNLNSFPFQNKNIRKALSLAINRQLLVDNITQCGETVATGSIPPLLKPLSKKVFFTDNDSALANQHLQLGLNELCITKTDLEKIVLSYPNNINSKRLAQAIQQQWKQALEITVRLEESEFKVLRERLVRKDYQIAFSSLVVQYNDQMNILDRFKSRNNNFNYPGFENEEYINLLNRSSCAHDSEERFSILEQAEQILTEEMPFTPLYHWNCVYLKQDRVHGLYISPIGSIHLNNIFLVEDI